jgi:hypothetical protein
MRKPVRPIPRGDSPAADLRCSSHQSAAPVTGVTGCFWSSADRSCPERVQGEGGGNARCADLLLRSDAGAGLGAGKDIPPNTKNSRLLLRKCREIRKFVVPITSTLSDLPPASTGLLEAAKGRSGTPEREGAARETPRLSPCRTEQASAAFGCSLPGPMIPAPPAWLPRIHPVQAKAQLLNSAEL